MNIELQKEGGVGTITINRPPVNILNIETMREFSSTLGGLKLDDSVKVIVVRGGGGKAFIGGVDVGEHTEEKAQEMVEGFAQLMLDLMEAEKPTIAAVSGIAMGGGFEVALYCDVIIASERASFSLPEIKLSVFPGPAISLLSRKIARNKAFELVMTGDPISAAEAERLGLVNKVVPPDQLEDAVKEFSARFTEKSLAALKLTRKAIYTAYELDIRKALEATNDIYLGLLMRTEDMHEGLGAFLEKRKPVWKNK